MLLSADGICLAGLTIVFEVQDRVSNPPPSLRVDLASAR